MESEVTQCTHSRVSIPVKQGSGPVIGWVPQTMKARADPQILGLRLPWPPRSGLRQWLSLFQGEIRPGFTQSASSEETLPPLTSSLRKGQLFWKISLGSAHPDDAPIAHISSGKPSVALPGTTTNYPHVATACLQGLGGVRGSSAGGHNPWCSQKRELWGYKVATLNIKQSCWAALHCRTSQSL